jgi:beta-lactamase class A
MMDLQKIVDEAIAAALKKFGVGGLTSDQLAISLVDLTDPQKPAQADFRGDAPAYPASVIKLFYMVAAHQQMADGTIQDTAELRRAMRDMIVDSGNEPTGYIMDVITDTTSGPDLPPAELAVWHEKRNWVNRYFHARGYPEINANRKTWHEGPYGRDRQAVEQFTPSRNSLTSNATVRLLVEIYTGRCVSPAHSTQMLELMRRDVSGLVPPDYQAREFIGSVVPPTTKIWSKAGYMSVARHDAAIIELANGKKLALVIFTERCSEEKDVIPEIGRHIVNAFLAE